jgi:hypothetical protein
MTSVEQHGDRPAGSTRSMPGSTCVRTTGLGASVGLWRRALPMLGIFLAAAGAFAQDAERKYPIFTVDHLHEAMKTVGLAFDLTGTAITKQDFPLAKDYLIRSRDQLATTMTFWRDRKDDAAVTLLRTALTQMDALDAAMSVDTIDPSGVQALSRSVTGACEACHARYREQDPVTKAYRVRADLLR